MNAATALSWQLWNRQRWTAAAIGVYLAALGVATSQPGALQWRVGIFSSAIPLAFVVLFFVARFAYPEGDVAGRAASFPAEQFLLPVRTSQLVFWPMLYGSLCAGAAWAAFALLALRPLGVEAPVVWPALLAAACVGWVQALLWTPMGLPYLRVVLALVAVPGLVTGAEAAIGSGVDVRLISGSLMVLLLAAYGTAVAGLTLARRGDVSDWTWRGLERSGRVARDSATMTAIQAQCDYELRSAGRLLPLVNTVIFVLLSLPLLWLRELTPLLPNAPAGSVSGIEVNLWLKLQSGSLFFPPLLAAILGFGRRSYDAAPRDFTLHPFLAVLPLSEANFVQARCRAAARSTALTWGITLLFAAGWLLLPARSGERAAPLLALLWEYCTPTVVGVWLLVLVVLVFWTWKNLVQGMWADLSGRALVVYGAPLLAHGLVLMTVVLLTSGFGETADIDPRYRPVPALLLWIVTGGLVVKAILTTVTSAALIRHRLHTPVQLAQRAAWWLGGVAALFTGLYWLSTAAPAAGPLASTAIMTYLPLCHDSVPAGLHSPPFLAAVSFLFWPFNRLSLATLALHRSRQG